MILEKRQLQRYMRHIIIPEISGQGQKKILDSSVLVYSDNVDNASSLLYYLSASGTGRIDCCFENIDGYEALFENIRDLNDDTTIELMNDLYGKNISGCKYEYNAVVLICDINNFPHIIKNAEGIISSSPAPVIAAICSGWRGLLQVFPSGSALDELTSCQEKVLPAVHKSSSGVGNILSSSLLGALSAIEVINTVLGLGKMSDNPLYIDLLTMEFKECTSEEMVKLSEPFTEPEGFMEKLNKARVLVVGCGGLGSPVEYALTRAGIGTIGLVDKDTVDISNLNRQILHSTSRIGLPKVKSAEIFLKKVNDKPNLLLYNTAFSKDNAVSLIDKFDIVVDAVDNFSARYLMNDACYFANKPMVEAGVLRFDGLSMTIIPGKSACYRCFFPSMPAAGTTPSCSENGVLGPLPGAMGFIEAAETVKIITGVGKLLSDRILFLDSSNMSFDITHLSKEPSCPLCGDNPSIKGLQNYEDSCTGA